MRQILSETAADLRHGVRMLGRSRGFAAVAILSLAIGIGANTAIFSVANALIFRPLAYRDPDRLTILWQRSPGLNVAQDWFSLGQYLDIKAEQHVFDDVAAAIGASFNMTGDGAPERVDGARVSSSFFSLLGTSAARGRLLTADEDKPGQPAVVVLSHAFWVRRFGGDTAIVGKTITLNGNTPRIVGVLPEGFSVSREVMPAVNAIRRADFFLPLPMAPSARANRGGEDFNIFGRLKRGTSVEHAQADMDRIAVRMKAEYPTNYPPNGGLTISVVPLIDQVVGDVRLALYVLLGAVAFVLTIACGNVANLQLSRAAIRERELAIRSAIGAQRRRLVQQLLTESVMLSLAGGVLGLVLAIFGVAAIRQFGPANIPRMSEVRIDGWVLVFTFLVSTLSGFAFGFWPAIRASSVDPRVASNPGSGSARFTGRHGRLRQTLIVAEVALSLLLVIGAGLLVRSNDRITHSNPGFDPTNVATLRVTLPGARYKTPEAVTNFYRQLEDRLGATPGVQHVGYNYQLPLSSVAYAWEPIGIEGYVPAATGNSLIIASSAYVSAGYFAAMGISMKTGRAFTAADIKGAPEVVIIDDKLAARFWPNQDPIGKRLRQGEDGPWRTVVGVVVDSKQYEPNAEPPITAFYPVEQYQIGSRFVVVKTVANAQSFARTIQNEIARLDPALPAYDVQTMEERLSDSLARRRLSMFLLATFAGVALVLAGIGIYGVIAYWVEQRTREIGIRVVLGAERSSIVGMILREFGTVVGLGLVVGVAGAFVLTRVMSGMLFGVSSTDLATFAVVPVILGVIALGATYLPARRALSVDPMTAVRADG